MVVRPGFEVGSEKILFLLEYLLDRSMVCQYSDRCQFVDTYSVLAFLLFSQSEIMGKKRKRGLAAREQQIMDVLYLLGKASVSDVREKLTDPPSYSAVRTMIGLLENKGLVQRDRTGVKHLYSPVKSRKKASRSALRSVMETFFPESPVDALAALIDDSAKELTPDDLDRLEQAIKRARKEGR